MLKIKATLKYPGAKWRIADFIVSRLPKHHSYVEPYFGSGAVLFNKPQSNIETINDLDNNVTNLFRIVRDSPENLAKAIILTPYSRDEYENSYVKNDNEDLVEKARKFLVRQWQGHGFRAGAYKAGWKNDVQGREKSYVNLCWNRLPDTILQACKRLKQVQIENRPAIEVIKRFNYSNVLIYADPPYLLSTRSGKNYECEMTNADHEELLETLRNHKGSVIISGYDNEMYNEYLKGWQTDTINTFAEHARPRTEKIWMNFAPTNNKQLSLL